MIIFVKMRISDPVAVFFGVTVNILLWQKGCTQDYFDLYSNNEVHKTKNHGFSTIAVNALSSADIPQAKDSNSDAVITSKYASIVGHPASPAPTKVPTVMLVAVLVAVFITALVMGLIHLVRKRKCSLLQKEFAMTTDDVVLSSTAIGNDPYRSITKRSSHESFSIPVPEEPGQTKPLLAPQMSVTSPSGRTTQLKLS